MGAEGRDAGLGGYSRPGQDHDVLRVSHYRRIGGELSVRNLFKAGAAVVIEKDAVALH